ncbi:MAG: hypothetical protein EXQ71_02955 [Acidimicrobiia bacterium]|nr:hypothetical protein [Acidimicrobiia bacterium]
MPRIASVFGGAVLVVGLLAVPAQAAPVLSVYVPPVDAAVADPFRPPTTPYGAGNRGLEYATAPGAVVTAAADGVVTFAGSVAGGLHVTLRHPDGVRTTYSFLARIDVVVGQRVRQGGRVGLTRDHLHFGARRGDAYFDPASLFGPSLPEVRLVPFDEPPGEGPAGERRSIEQLVGGAVGLAGRGVHWLRSGSQSLATLGHYAGRLGLPEGIVIGARVLLAVWGQARAQAERPCSAPAVEAPPPVERRLALLVAGLGSNSQHAAVTHINTAGLGYGASDVLRFSYAGGRTPDPSDGLAAIPASAYGPADTQINLRTSGARLADLIEAMATEQPGVLIDLYAHSQGGVVVRLALIELETRHGVEWLAHLGLVTTLGSPHGGANLATAMVAVGSTRLGGMILDGYAVATDATLDRSALSAAQLSEVSEVVRELQGHPIPPTVRAVSLAARGDLIVPVPSTRAPGAAQIVVPIVGPGAHTRLPGSAEAHRELGLALAGLPPGCRSFADTLGDQMMGEALRYGEDVAGALAWAAAAALSSRG